MSHIVEDRVKETSTTTGTGNMTLAGAATGFQAFSAVCANNDTFFYCIAHQAASEWEIGLGTYVSATPALARTTVLESSNSGNAVSFSAGTKDVFITLPSYGVPLKALPSDAIIPGAGITLLHTKALAGRHVPRFVGASGIDSAVQPTLWGNSVVMWLPGTGTTAAISFGVSWTVSSTQAHPTIDDTSVMTRMKRATYTTTTTAGNQSGTRSTAPIVIRRSGFFFVARWGILTYSSTMQCWAGLGAASGIISGDPSAANNSCGMSKDTGETTWQVFTRDGSTTSKTSVGVTTAAAGNTGIFDIYMFARPNDTTKITFRVVDVGDDSLKLADTDKSSNLPTISTALYAHCECRNVAGGAGSAIAVFLSKLYVEADT